MNTEKHELEPSEGSNLFTGSVARAGLASELAPGFAPKGCPNSIRVSLCSYTVKIKC